MIAASIGGVIGLCLGGSVLSIIEFLYYFFKSILCEHRDTRDKKKQEKVSKNVWTPKLYSTDFKTRI